MASNAEEPPSKKRVASRQISKNDDLESEEDEGTGTFRRASEEVLAERRMVKVRRTPATGSSFHNPFATICLVPPSAQNLQETLPTNSGVASHAVVEGVSFGVTTVDVNSATRDQPTALSESDSLASKTLHTEVTITPSLTEDPEKALEEKLKSGEKRIEEVQVSPKMPESKQEAQAAENGYNGRANGGEPLGACGTSSETFQQLSSATNAFAGSFGTGFSTTPFVFSSSSSAAHGLSGFPSYNSPFGLSSQPLGSSLSSGSGETNPTLGFGSSGAASFPSISSVFGTSNGASSAGLFGSSEPSSATGPLPTPQKSSVVSLQEIHVETGEEKEKSVFTAEASLFEFHQAWKERGKGELRVNVSEEKGKKPRLVMRAKGNYRLLLNANLFPDMKLSKMDNRGISFCCVNSAVEGKTGLTTYAVKLKDSTVASEFFSVVQAHKAVANAEPKTPESSPKATERPLSLESNEVDA